MNTIKTIFCITLFVASVFSCECIKFDDSFFKDINKDDYIFLGYVVTSDTGDLLKAKQGFTKIKVITKYSNNILADTLIIKGGFWIDCIVSASAIKQDSTYIFKANNDRHNKKDLILSACRVSYLQLVNNMLPEGIYKLKNKQINLMKFEDKLKEIITKANFKNK